MAGNACSRHFVAQHQSSEVVSVGRGHQIHQSLAPPLLFANEHANGQFCRSWARRVSKQPCSFYRRPRDTVGHQQSQHYVQAKISSSCIGPLDCHLGPPRRSCARYPSPNSQEPAAMLVIQLVRTEYEAYLGLLLGQNAL